MPSRPVDIASSVFFRVTFGLVMFVWVCHTMTGGMLENYYTAATFHFTYDGFDWIKPLSHAGMQSLFCMLGVACLFIVLGLWYRIATAFFFLAFTYTFFIERTNYQNHYYFICLLGFLLCFVPAHRAFSLDVLRKPELRSATTPAWCLQLLRFQVALPYVYGGIAKINSDWLQGQPMGKMLQAHLSWPVIGPLFHEKWPALFLSYGGLFFDLLIVPAIFWRRTRPFALVLVLFFHLSNSALFTIDIFPYLMIAATTIFLNPEWPRLFLKTATVSAKDRNHAPRPSSAEQHDEVRREPHGVETEQVSALDRNRAPRPSTAEQRDEVWREPHGIIAAHVNSRPSSTVLILLSLYSTIQILLPLRNLLYPGPVAWHEQGQLFAWRMLVRTKEGHTIFYASEPGTGETREIKISDYLTERQFGRMLRRPDMIHQFSIHLSEKLSEGRPERVAIHVVSLISLNGRKPQLMIDPKIDLAAQPRSFRPVQWILPLTEPLL